MNKKFFLFGLISSILSLKMLEHEATNWFGPGIIFSLILTFLLKKYLRDISDKIKFVVFTTLSYVIVYTITFTIGFGVAATSSYLPQLARMILPCITFIIGGMLGGWLLSLIINKYIFGPDHQIRMLSSIIMGGILASSIFIGEIPQTENVLNNGYLLKYLLLDQNDVDFFGPIYPIGIGIMFIIWQVGMATFISQNIKKRLNV